jgi:hypothetical protein
LLADSRSQHEFNLKEFTLTEAKLPKVDAAEIWLDAGIYAQKNRLYSKGLGLIDTAIIVCARRYQGRIWSLDKKLLAVLDASEVFEDAAHLADGRMLKYGRSVFQ